MNEITFSIFGNPKALKRHRMTKTGHVYDPSAKEKESFIAQAVKYKPDTPIDFPISVALLFVFARPKYHFNSKGELKPNAPQYYSSRPDVDNLIKFVLDSLNGIYWKDDAVVSKVIAVKEYGEHPGVTGLIQEMKKNN